MEHHNKGFTNVLLNTDMLKPLEVINSLFIIETFKSLLHISTVALSGKEITHLQACICHKFAYFTVPTFSNLHAPHHQPNQLSPLWCKFLIHIALVRLFQLWIHSYNKRMVKMKYTSRQKTQGDQTQNSPLCEYDGENHQVHWLAIPHL